MAAAPALAPAVEEALKTIVPEQILFSEWVVKKKGERDEDRLLVVTPYRIITLKKKMLGTPVQIAREASLYQLKVLESDSNSVLKLTFDNPMFIFECEAMDTTLVIALIVEAYNVLTIGFPDSAKFRYSVARALPPVQALGPLPICGLLWAYRARCHAGEELINPEIEKLLESLSDSRTLDISRILNVDSPKKTVLTSLFLALQYNVWFTTLTMRKLQRGDLASNLPPVLANNSTLTALNISDCPNVDYQLFFAAIQPACESDTGLSRTLVELDLSGTGLRDKHLTPYSAAVVMKTLRLRTLNLARNQLSKAGLTLLLKSIPHLKTVLRELNLSENKCDATHPIADWLKGSGSDVLQSLNIASCNVKEVNVLGESLASCPSLTSLNISNCATNKRDVQGLADGLINSNVTDLNLSDSKITPEGTLAVLGAMVAKSVQVTVNISDICMEKDPEGLANVIRGRTNLVGFLYDGGELKFDGFIDLLDALFTCSALRVLSLSRNVKAGHKKATVIADKLIALLQAVPVEQFTLQGNKSWNFGDAVVPIVRSVGKSPNITKLDVSHNFASERLGFAVSEIIPTAARLAHVDFDGNSLTTDGWRAIVTSVQNSNTISNVVFPREDFRAIKKSETPESLAALMDLMKTQVIPKCRSNAARSGERPKSMWFNDSQMAELLSEDDILNAILNGDPAEQAQPAPSPPPPVVRPTSNNGNTSLFNSISSDYGTPGSASPLFPVPGAAATHSAPTSGSYSPSGDNALRKAPSLQNLNPPPPPPPAAAPPPPGSNFMLPPPPPIDYNGNSTGPSPSSYPLVPPPTVGAPPSLPTTPTPTGLNVTFSEADFPVHPVVSYGVEWLRNRGLEEVGLFRVPASVSESKALLARFNRGEAVDLYSETLDPILVSGLIKLYFRETSSAQFPPALQSALEATDRMQIDSQKRAAYREILASLCYGRLQTLTLLVGLFVDVVAYEKSNMMNAGNMSTVFAPTLFPNLAISTATRTLYFWIENYAPLFLTP